jgi:glutamine synthetase
MCAIIAPLVNSYKRLAGGAEAPGHVYWARVNREALIRVAETTAARGNRVELRTPDPGCNPYLALAVALRAGLDGIDNEIPMPPPMEMISRSVEDAVSERNADPLPATLHEALEEMEWDPIVREALGQAIFEFLLTAKEQEWLAYRQHITNWETERYLEGA